MTVRADDPLPPGQDVTLLLRAWGGGDSGALATLTPLVYQELYRRAQWHMARENPGHTLQATALVNEIYVKMVDVRGVSWRDRAHFFAVASRLIRQILIDAARSRNAQKRGGQSPHVPIDESILVSEEPRADLLALDDALTALAAFDARKSRVVELRCFGGLDIEETAEVIGVSAETIKRDWKLAKAWLRRELEQRPNS